ncbi:unnamed protein product [Prunus brigantina]
MLVLFTIADENSRTKCSNSLTNGLVHSKDSQDKREKKEGTRRQQRKFSSYKKDAHEQPRKLSCCPRSIVFKIVLHKSI